MQDIILFGASNLGKIAYQILSQQYNILYFCDNDSAKWGQKLFDKEIKSPTDLIDQRNAQVIISSYFETEIANQLDAMGISNYDVFSYNYSLKNAVNGVIAKNLSKITLLDVGAFIYSLNKEINIKDLTFMVGGSNILDYVFLKALCVKFNLDYYLEIGTLRGESIAAISTVAKEAYSISLPDEVLTSFFENIANKGNFGRFFSRNISNIIHYYGDSSKFDYNSLPNKPQLVFIDGDHSYEGIKKDTKLIFDYINLDECIVVWHDFKGIRRDYIMTTVKAVYDAVPRHLHSKIYAMDTNMCGVYIPDKYRQEFVVSNRPEVLYSYETTIRAKENICPDV